MGKHLIETIMGAVVLLVALGFLVFAYHSGNISTTTDGYKLYAEFDRADGLSTGSDVRISGIKIGQVAEQRLNMDNYLAKIVLSLDKSVQIPVDSTAEIASDGLLGGKYLSIVPGGDEKMLKDGDQIKYTQSSISLESLIGKFMYGGAGDKKQPSDPNTSQEQPKQKGNHTNVLD